jgi:L-threonylcarbamoyladenylate synthase
VPDSRSAADVQRAAAILRAGGLVAFPTETVYGLGAAARNPAALARLYAVKARPADHPAIVHLASAEDLGAWAAEVPPAAAALASAFWPGPLTLVLRRGGGVPHAVTGGRETIGLRVPAQPLALALLGAFGDGIAAPSANRFGAVSPTTAAHVRESLGDDVDLILDGGPCSVGVESTIVDLSTPAAPLLLRAGGTPVEEIAAVLGAVPRPDLGPARAPGMLAAHYAPRARVEVCADGTALAARAVALLAAGSPSVAAVLPSQTRATLPPELTVLARPRDTAAYARDLYALLRDADARGISTLLVVPPDAAGIGLAVRDRLARAAASADGERA